MVGAADAPDHVYPELDSPLILNKSLVLNVSDATPSAPIQACLPCVEEPALPTNSNVAAPVLTPAVDRAEFCTVTVAS